VRINSERRRCSTDGTRTGFPRPHSKNDETHRSQLRVGEIRRGNAQPRRFPMVEVGKQHGASSDRESIGPASVDHLMST
jgi:hypothetical protein